MGAVEYWIWLSCQRNVSAGAKAGILAHYSDPELAFFAPEGEFAKIPGLSEKEAKILEKRDMSRVSEIISACASESIRIVTMQDADYPKRLKNIFAPPSVVYVKGRLPDWELMPHAAVIGTRSASPYGLKMGRRMAFEIAKCGGAVISMLSEGVDSKAAEGCLEAGGLCIGVLGTAHGGENALQRDILSSGGALVSEYPPGTEYSRHFFRDRNRIASGLSHAVVVVEAPEKSGALLFAATALEQGREIYALPGNADAAGSAGSNRLIKEGAKPVTQGWDLMEDFEYLFPERVKRPAGPMELPETAEKDELSPAPSAESGTKPRKAPIKELDKKKDRDYIDLRSQLSELGEEQLAIINSIEKETHIDDIIEKTGMSTAKVLSQLTVLEIKGYVRRSAGRRVSLNIKSK